MGDASEQVCFLPTGCLGVYPAHNFLHARPGACVEGLPTELGLSLLSSSVSMPVPTESAGILGRVKSGGVGDSVRLSPVAASESPTTQAAGMSLIKV